MNKSVTIIWNETELLEVVGFYAKGRPMSNDRVNPPEDSDFEIEKIMYKGIEVTALFSDEDYYIMQDKCLMLIES